MKFLKPTIYPHTHNAPCVSTEMDGRKTRRANHPQCPGRKSVGVGVYSIIIIGLLAGGAVFLYQKYSRPDTGNPNDYLTLEEASGMGETANYKLMIQIETPKGSPTDEAGRYQRGDIVLILPAEHEFSPAEKSGFLIIKMDLTQKQTELLTQSLDKITNQKDRETGLPQRETLKRRKFTVALEKLGIVSDDNRGQEITDKVFLWEEVIQEKTEN